MNRPAGWYPQANDPNNVRWWDGTQWTEHTQPAMPAGPVEVQQPKEVRRGGIALGGALLVFFGFFMLGSIDSPFFAFLFAVGGLIMGIVALSKRQRFKVLSIISICIAPVLALVGISAGASDTPTVAAAEPFVAQDYNMVDARELAQIVKDPDDAKGKKIITFAKITQFDSAMGKCQFRADTGHKRFEKAWDYDHNSVYTTKAGSVDCADLGDFVADDVVQVHATVGGSKRYETMIGGETVVPFFRVDSIKLVK